MFFIVLVDEKPSKERKISKPDQEISVTSKGPILLEKLQTVGIDVADITKLKEGGIYTVEALTRTPKRDLAMIKGLSEKKVQALLQKANGLLESGFQPASALLEQRREIVRITTGSEQLDAILEGGIEAGSITEVYGEFRSGKTQLCHTLAVACQLPVPDGGGEGKCLFLDTEGTFRPQRLVQIAARFGLESKTCLQNVAYVRAYNTEQQTRLLATAASIMAETRFSLIVVDSATAMYRYEFKGRGELSSRQMHLGRFLGGLNRLAGEFGVAVIITNQVVASGFDGNPVGRTSTNPIGGNIMAHATTTRLSMSKGRGQIRRVKLVASPCAEEAVVEVCIKKGGITDSDSASITDGCRPKQSE